MNRIETVKIVDTKGRIPSYSNRGYWIVVENFNGGLAAFAEGSTLNVWMEGGRVDFVLSWIRNHGDNHPLGQVVQNGEIIYIRK